MLLRSSHSSIAIPLQINSKSYCWADDDKVKELCLSYFFSFFLSLIFCVNISVFVAKNCAKPKMSEERKRNKSHEENKASKEIKLKKAERKEILHAFVVFIFLLLLAEM